MRAERPLPSALTDVPAYAPCYCEENVYKIILQLHEQGGVALADLAALFLTSSSRLTPLWEQDLGQGGSNFVLWDYHVLGLQRKGDSWQVWDLASTLPCPCGWDTYSRAALRPGHAEAMGLQPRVLRVVSARYLLANFASDRSHMRTQGGEWSMPPPPWPCIGTPGGSTNTLPQFLDTSRDLGPGTFLCSEAELGGLAWEAWSEEGQLSAPGPLS